MASDEPIVDHRALFEASPNPYMMVDRDLRYVAANEAYLRATASRLDDLVGRSLFEVFPNDPTNPNDESTRLVRESLERALRTGERETLALVRYRVPIERDGRVELADRWWSATHSPVRDARGEVVGVLQHTVDVTEVERARIAQHGPRHQVAAGLIERAKAVQHANVALDEERRHLRRLFEQAPGFMCVLRGPEHVFELANDAYLQLVGRADIVGKTVRAALPELEGQGWFELLDDVFASRVARVGRGMRVELAVSPGELLEERFVDYVYQPIVGPDGSATGIFVQGHDVTEQHRARTELARYRNHLEELVLDRTRALAESEAALRQAHKMEAVGKLTGGIAHDFNNLLQVIGANLALLAHDVGDDVRATRRVQSAAAAVARGSKLSSQLLAYARRQPLEPVVLDVGRLVGDLEDLVRRAVGEDVELAIRVTDGVATTFVDRNQLENAILNLVINARDAMDAGGRLAIEVSSASLPAGLDVAPGHYVALTVSDSGAGMTADVRDRAFEPFFTTKGEARGTGLGLSMVYGFVKQSGGHVEIDSEVGRGTTIRIYLPRDERAEDASSSRAPAPVVGGSERILVVEDDPAVRATTVEVLRELGYRVVEAADGQAALAILESGASIDLVFSDVVMPGPVRGAELVRRVAELSPGVPVLFTSGYTEDEIVHGGRLDPGVQLLGKPYSPADLAQRVRALLDARALPDTRALPHPEAPPHPEASLDAPPAARALRILVVEDHEDMREVVLEMMRGLGHEAAGAGSAREAKDALTRERFDVLFTDVGLPGVSGIDLAREALRDDPALALVLASGWGDALLQRDAALGAAVVLGKPYADGEIREALREAIVRVGRVA